MRMDTGSSVPQIYFSNIPVSGHGIVIDDLVMIDDNLTEDISGGKASEASTDKDIPFKLMTALCIFCLDGELQLRLNQNDYLLRKNDIFIGLPGLIVEQIHIRSSRVIVGMIAQAHFGKTLMASSETIRNWLLGNNGIGILHCVENACNAIASTYRAFRIACTSIDRRYLFDAVVGFFHSVTPTIASWVDQSRSNDVVNITRKKEITMKFFSDVQKYCNTERSVTFYAGRCCLSPKYFARIITETLGKKPGDVIRDNVILEAKVMLVSNNLSVQQISDRMHFPNASFFCKYFKAATGCTPRQYQLYGEKAAREKSED